METSICIFYRKYSDSELQHRRITSGAPKPEARSLSISCPSFVPITRTLACQAAAVSDDSVPLDRIWEFSNVGPAASKKTSAITLSRRKVTSSFEPSSDAGFT
ncbi:Hypothetical protein NTJ_07645 [Nesidiocoris tenuis]|uniref:Uncharacterized protein n=1 Tax=Nesidiocoris tenuis TaxID=355587 RepID=A0ABN7ARJ4_9HEMI|nr:Hypothetical protein NTJ_07645 [Nesidiocoris tenuis]